MSCLFWRQTWSLTRGVWSKATSVARLSETLDIWRNQQGLPGGGSISAEPWCGGGRRVPFGAGTSAESFVFASPGPDVTDTSPAEGTTQALCWINTVFLGLGLWWEHSPLSSFGTHGPLALAKDVCPPVTSCSLSPYQLKMNFVELSCQTMHKLFPCRAKTCGSLQQFFIIYIFD